MPQTLLEIAGNAGAPLLHIAPANGFPPQTYLPMLRGLSAEYRAICFPPRALWGDGKPPREYRDWSMAADDLLAAFHEKDMRDIVAMGHSFGGIASLLAVIQEPQRFKALILLDPVILMPDQLRLLQMAHEQDAIEQMPTLQGALRRRRHFESKEAAYQRFRKRSSFADWSDELLWLYIEHGLKTRADAAGVELAWSVEWEVYYYATIFQPIWQVLPKLEGLLPVLIMRGGTSDTFTEEALQLTRSILPSAAVRELAGQGHLFPQAAPHETARIIGDWLGSIGG